MTNAKVYWILKSNGYLWKYWRIQSNKKRKILIVFDDMVADKLSNKKLIPTVNELFIRCRKINISLVFTTQPYFAVPKNVRLNSKQKRVSTNRI